MEHAINHMNDDHQDSLIAMAKYFGKKTKVTSATLLSIEGNQLKLKINNNEDLTITLPEVATKENIKSMLIALSKESKGAINSEKIEKLGKQATEYMDSFKSVILATINKENETCATYAPILKYNGEMYIYISEIADHYTNLKHNPSLEIAFLEDESLAKLIVLRKRLRFRAKAEFINKDDKYEDILNTFETKVDSTVKTLRTMHGFHLVKLHLSSGRFVKGFGQAYEMTYDPAKGCIAGEQITSNKENPNSKAHGGSVNIDHYYIK